MLQNDNPDLSIAIDFGTSNTVVAVADKGGAVDAVKFTHGDESFRVYMSALCFWEERVKGAKHVGVEGGQWAVEQFLDGAGPHRFIQSFKTFAASRAFHETWIFRQKFRFEDLLAAFLRTLARHAGSQFDFSQSSLVVGRPVRFAGGTPDDALAIKRYTASFERLGVKTVHYVYEPVGAAFFFARRLKADATVLVADFGGGTSDFSILRFLRQDGRLRAQPLGNAGVGIAGDTFDYRIIDKIVSPKLGKGDKYRSFGKLLTMPNGHFSNVARWHQLAMMKSSGELKELIELSRLAIDPAPLLKFIELIENDLGFALYRAVSSAKIALSFSGQTQFHFQSGSIDIGETITRANFESWISQDVARIAETIDGALGDARISASEVDRVFLTGGSSFIPAIRRIFSERFGDDKIDSGDQFESIAYGLALMGQSHDLAQWESVKTAAE